MTLGLLSLSKAASRAGASFFKVSLGLLKVSSECALLEHRYLETQWHPPTMITAKHTTSEGSGTSAWASTMLHVQFW